MASLVQWVVQPFEMQFMRFALLAAVLAALNCSLVGVYVILRRMSFLGGALAHTILPGLVFAWLRNIPLFWGALGAGIITALGVGWIADRKRVHEDAAIGIILSAMFALGLLLMSLQGNFRDFANMLFGNILTVSPADLVLTISVTTLLMVAFTLLYKEWELSTLDEEYARLVGLRPVFLRYLLLILVALSVVSAVPVVGALLSTALLITPPATAALLAGSLRGMILVSAMVGALSSIIGLYVSYYAEVSAGAAIALTATGFFLIAKIFTLVGNLR